MDTHKNASLTPKGREAMVRSVVEGGLSKTAAARRFNTTTLFYAIACPISAVPAPGINTVSTNCRQTHRQLCSLVQRRGTHMRFEIIAEKDSETVRMKRNSSLIAIAKARVWASEGWSVTIRVNENAPGLVKQLAPPLN
jgi:hypothetical protein